MRSTKEKRYEELTNLIKQIRNYKKIKDMSNMLTGFEDLMKAYTKALPVVQKEENGHTPRFYTRCLVELDDFITEMWENRDGRKNLSKNNSKSLTSLRQKLRRYIKDFSEDISKFRENPDQPDEEEEEEKGTLDKLFFCVLLFFDIFYVSVESDVDSDVEIPIKVPSKAPERQKAAPGPAGSDDDSEDSTYWGSDSESDSESSVDFGAGKNMREHFLKRDYIK